MFVFLNRIRVVGISCVLLGVLTGFVQAGEENLGAMFLKEATGARSAALGEAFVAVAEDVNSVYWNPAGMVRVPRRELLATHTQFIQGFRDEYFAFCTPWSNQDAVGANLFFSYADFERVTAQMETAGTFNVYDAYVGLAWSHALDSQVAVGCTLKGIYQVVDAWSAWTLAADIAGVMNEALPGLTLGAVVRNLGKPIRFIEKTHPLPLTFEAGAAYRTLADSLLLCVSLAKPLEQEMNFHVGVEYNIENMLFARAGYTYAQFGNDLGVWSGFSCGIGAEIWDYKLDYAYSPYSDLGDVHRVSLTFPFGRSVKEEEKIILRLEKQIKSKQEAIVQNHIQAGDQWMQQEQYAQALQAYARARLANPDYPGLTEKIKQVEDKQNVLWVKAHLTKGQQAYAAKDYLTALIEWSKGLELSPQDPELQQGIKLANQKLSEEKVSNVAEKNSQVINDYFSKGLGYMESRRYTEAMAVWSKILDLEPGNPRVTQYIQMAKNRQESEITDLLDQAAESWKRGAVVEAVTQWHRVLNLDPKQSEAIKQLKVNESTLDQLATEYYKQGTEKYVRNRLDAAIADWKIVLVLDPGHSKAIKNIEHVQRKQEELKLLK